MGDFSVQYDLTGLSTQNTGGKVSKIRFDNTKQEFESNEVLFATGSWDTPKENTLLLWNVEQSSFGLSEQANFKFSLLGKTTHEGDVTDLKFIGDNLILSSSSNGSLNAFQLINTNTSDMMDFSADSTLQRVMSRQLHSFSDIRNASLNSFAIKPYSINDPLVATVGEDGKIVIVRIEDSIKDHVIEKADASSIKAILWPRSNEIIIANGCGQLRLFDPRESKLTTICYDPNNVRIPINCLTFHPSKIHKVASGNNKGGVTIWDTRKLSEPEKHAQPHKSRVWDLFYHPYYHELLFSCSEDGTIGAINFADSVPIRKIGFRSNELPINSLDYHPHSKLLIGGGDNENLLYTLI
ncbi:13049_t:CDS:2 [Funneliformis mosseae]|uniref:13049_t:CDS:1 n=1 Tax=Funneliformis mosseae TaxID=27381 RepID=A0A9N8V2W2_FUNMO|nr:13049_t:CDS:2 [Funneliformis mosseae]